MNLRSKASEVLEAGKAERGNFIPTGAPLKVYKYWLENTPRKRRPERENFCHYWRVVAFWGPLKWTKNTLTDFFTSKVGVAFLVLAYIGLFIALGMATSAAFAGLVVPWFILGVGLAAILALEDEPFSKKEQAWVIGLSILTFPVVVPFYLLFRAGRWSKEHWNSKWNRPVQLVVVAISVFALAALTVSWLVIMTLEVGWIFWAILVASFAALFVIVIGFSMLSDFLAGRRRRARIARANARTDFYDEHGYFPEEAPKDDKPENFFVRFGRGIADFIIFVAQVVRVKKWKICPIVTVPEEENVSTSS
jgi:hypothetical protein